MAAVAFVITEQLAGLREFSVQFPAPRFLTVLPNPTLGTRCYLLLCEAFLSFFIAQTVEVRLP